MSRYAKFSSGSSDQENRYANSIRSISLSAYNSIIGEIGFAAVKFVANLPGLAIVPLMPEP